MIFLDNLLLPLCLHHQLQMGGYYNGLGLSHAEQIIAGGIFLMKTMYSVTHEKVFVIAEQTESSDEVAFAL